MDSNKIHPLLVREGISVKDAINRLNDTAEKILFVVDDNEKLIGTVTDGDIRRGIIGGINFSSGIGTVMQQSFVAIDSDVPDRILRAQRIMLDKKIEQVPVIDDSGLLVDVIQWTDIIGNRSDPEAHKTNPVVIMAGGKGTRMDPFTRILPKALIPVGDKPVIEIIMERFHQYGFHSFFYTLNYKKEYLQLFLKDNPYPYDIDWVVEESFMGTAGSLRLLEGKLHETFFVSNCDSILDVDFTSVMDWHKEHQAAITIIGCHNEVKIPFGVLEIQDGRLGKILEKPVQDVIINTGVYVMEPAILKYIPAGEKTDMNTLIDIVKEKEKVSVFPIHGSWFDLGQWDEYQESVLRIRAGRDA